MTWVCEIHRSGSCFSNVVGGWGRGGMERLEQKGEVEERVKSISFLSYVKHSALLKGFKL